MKKILFPVVCALIAAVLLLSAPVSSPPAAAESMTVHFDDGAAVWTECEGATNYVVSVADADGGEVLRATVSSSTLFYPLSDLLAAGGEYTVTVTAYSDATPVATASASFAHTVTLASPALSFADGTLSWSALAGSSGYAVTLNGVDLGTVTTTSVYLGDLAVAAGSYTVSVIRSRRRVQPPVFSRGTDLFGRLRALPSLRRSPCRYRRQEDRDMDGAGGRNAERLCL